MYLIQGLVSSFQAMNGLLSLNSSKVACIIGVVTYWWMVDFPERAQFSFHFLDKNEVERAVARIQSDRGDVQPTPFSWLEVSKQFLDPKLYGFAAMFFLLVGHISSLIRAIDLPKLEPSLDRLVILFAHYVCSTLLK